MARGDTGSSGQPFNLTRLNGGLETKRPAHQLKPSETPDSVNVHHANDAAERRGGFPPLIRKAPKLNSIKNAGYHGRMRIRRTAGAGDGDFLHVPGCMLAGHRAIYENLRASYSVECFFRVDDLTQHHVGCADVAGGGAVYYPVSDVQGFPIVVRPILSKGPSKKTYDTTTAGPCDGGAANPIQWKPGTLGNVNYYGLTGAEAGMPFCLYIWQNPASLGTFEFRCSFHSVITASSLFELLTVKIPSATLQPKVGTTYHLIFAITQGTSATLRVGVLGDDGTLPTYYTSSGVYDVTENLVTFGNYRAPAQATVGPFQAFDCPQEFIEAPNAISGVRPPGLELTGVNEGGYFFAAKRAEGALEDIAFWTTNKLTGGATTLDRFTKLDFASLGQTDLAGYWSMAEEGSGYVQEMTGRGNHFYLVPAGPTYTPLDGAPQSESKAAWWFNGNNSYALADLEVKVVTSLGLSQNSSLVANQRVGNYNWRWYLSESDATPNVFSRLPSAFQRIVVGNLAHGLEVTFWPDAIETRFEQVIMEIHSVLRLAIGTDGRLVGYCRNADPQPALGSYQDLFVQSPVVCIPGERYTVTLLRLSGGTSLELYVNGALVATTAGLDPNDANGPLICGVTFGMGAWRFTGYTNQNGGIPPTVGTNGDLNQVATDYRSGFIGRIESGRVLVGSGTLHANYKDEDDTSWIYKQQLLWRAPSVNTIPTSAVLSPTFENRSLSSADFDNVAAIVVGHVLGPGGHKVDVMSNHLRPYQIALRYPISAVGVQTYTTAGSFREPEEGGYEGVVTDAWGIAAAKIPTYATFARWVFDKDDKDLDYCGTYQDAVEGYMNGTTFTLNGYLCVHVQLSQVTDELGVLGPIEKRCLESDQADFVDTGTGAPERSVTSRGRPYRFRSPKELAPRWSPGLIRPLTGTTPLTLIADYQHQKSGEVFTIVGCSRDLYWAKPRWRRSSPFGVPSDYAAWTFGQANDYIRVLASNPGQDLIGDNTVISEAWVYPTRLDGTRILALKGDLTVSRVNYAIAFVDGMLEVFGSGANGTLAWLYRQGTGTTPHRSEVALKANAWNHVYVYMGANSSGTQTVVAWINGQRLNMTAATGYDAFPGIGPDFGVGTYPLYLMGVPSHLANIRLPGATALVQTLQSWHGYMTEFRSRGTYLGDSPEEAAFPSLAGSNGYMPKARYTTDTRTRFLLHLNEGVGWDVPNSATELTTELDCGSMWIDELIRLDENAESLEESKKAPYQSVVFRDELIVTNGVDKPKRVRFTRYSDADGPFRLASLGMQTPFSYGVGFTTFQRNTAGTFNVYDESGEYHLWVTFLNELGEESDAFPAYDHYFTDTGANQFAGFRMAHLPRSPDPQVVGRRFYFSTNSGGGALVHSDLPDNESYEHQLFGLPTAIGLETGIRLPAPRGRQVTASGGKLQIAHLTETAAGANQFAISSSTGIAYWPLNNRVGVDSRNGRSITGIAPHLGRFYIGKRDSIWQFDMTGDVISADDGQARLQVVNESVGLGGGMTLHDNLIFGADSGGVSAFDGANPIYVSSAIEADYQALDLTDDGLRAMYGLYHRPEGQFWLSVRRPYATSNEYVYVLQRTVADRQVWQRWLVPRHTYMASVLLADSLEQVPLIGTDSGQLLRYNPDLDIDGMDNTDQDGAPVVLQGVVASSTGTSITIAPATGQGFPTIGYGLRGCKLRVGTGASVAEFTIESNTRTTITWRGSAVAPISIGDAFVVGPFNAEWSTGWLEPQEYGHFCEVKFIDLDFQPTDCDLQVDNHVAQGSVGSNRAFPTTGMETRTTDLTNGFLKDPLPVKGKNRGRYFRVRVKSDGILCPFAVTGMALRYTDTGIRGGPQ